MTTLRERGREALKAGDLDRAEAASDLDRVLARTRARPRWPFAIPAVLIAAAAGVYLLVGQAPPALVASTEIYIRVEGEPPESALALTITTVPAARTVLGTTLEGARP